MLYNLDFRNVCQSQTEIPRKPTSIQNLGSIVSLLFKIKSFDDPLDSKTHERYPLRPQEGVKVIWEPIFFVISKVEISGFSGSLDSDFLGREWFDRQEIFVLMKTHVS